MNPQTNYVLRCPVVTTNTLTIDFDMVRKKIPYTNDPEVIRALKKSAFVLNASSDGKGKNYLKCSEIFPNLEPDEKGFVALPNFGFFVDQVVWISPHAISACGKEIILEDISRCVSKLFLVEVRSKP